MESATTKDPIDTLKQRKYGKCEPGYYCPKGTEAMIPCPIGTINDNSGSDDVSDCSPCPEGYYCDRIGATSATYGIDISSTLYTCGPGFLCTGGAKN